MVRSRGSIAIDPLAGLPSWGWVAVVIAVLAGIVQLARSDASGMSVESFDARCGAWDRAAAASVAALLDERDATIEARLGEAVFRLRRARRNCRQDWVGLSRHDYDVLVSGRFGRRP